jgi:hypothetical protein
VHFLRFPFMLEFFQSTSSPTNMVCRKENGVKMDLSAEEIKSMTDDVIAKMSAVGDAVAAVQGERTCDPSKSATPRSRMLPGILRVRAQVPTGLVTGALDRFENTIAPLARMDREMSPLISSCDFASARPRTGTPP